MSELFPNNIFDPEIVNQPEQEYRKAKYPFHIRHMYIDATTKEKNIGIHLIAQYASGIKSMAFGTA